jgi:urease alpha subunit
MPVNTTSALTVGDKIRMTVAVLSTGGVATDSHVTFIVQPPSSTAATVGATTSTSGGNGVTHSTTGTWYFDHLTTEAGDYKWWFRSTGTIVLTTGGRVAVRSAYATS